jgi:hypothetical protein
MTNKVIYFDEAGNTGAALLDDKQPVFVLASVDFSDSEAKELLDCVTSSQGAEAKFTSIRKSERGKRKLIDFFKQSPLNPNNVKVTLYHKKYMVITKLVDIIIETLAHKDGIDIYQRGANIALSNLHYYAMPVFCGRERTIHFLESFIAMIRKKDQSSIDQFFYHGWQLYGSSINEKYTHTLAPFLIAEKWIHDILYSIDYLSLDPAIPSLFDHCIAWGKEYNQEFEILHDESKPLYAERDLFRDIMNVTMPPKEIGYDRRKFEFPLKAKNLNFGSSVHFQQLQIADLIASASAYLNVSRLNDTMDNFSNALEQDTKLDSFRVNALWPAVDITAEEESGVNSVDYIVGALKN